MSENLNRGIRDFSKYDSMETEELERILRLDADAPDGTESDTELLLYVMEVLARRKNTTSTGDKAQKAWESFQQNYMPDEYVEKERTRTATPLLRRMIAVAAVVALVILIPISAQALSLDKLWDIFARWAEETFSFVTDENAEISEPNSEYNGEYSSLQDVLLANNRDSKIIPTWIPSGFILEKIEKDITPIQELYAAFYLHEERKLQIQVRTFLSSDFQKTEVAGETVDIYNVSGIDYYIFENETQLRAIWIVDSYECLISGDLSLDEIKNMIESIQKG